NTQYMIIFRVVVDFFNRQVFRPVKPYRPPGFFVRAGASHCPVAVRFPDLHVSSALFDRLIFIQLHK
ncbi:hypothetical protein ACVGX7_23640, partial [Enterobacter hormaechei]